MNTAKQNAAKISSGELTPELNKAQVDNPKDIIKNTEVKISPKERSAIGKVLYNFSTHHNLPTYLTPQGVITLRANSLDELLVRDLDMFKTVMNDIVEYADQHGLPVGIRGYFMIDKKVNIRTTEFVKMNYGFKAYQGQSVGVETWGPGPFTLIRPNGGITEFSALMP